MNSLSFTSFLTSNLPIEENDVLKLVKVCHTKQVKQGEFLLREGEFCKHSFFVEQGLLKQYTLDQKGKEHILYFAPQGWFVADRVSVFLNQPSTFLIEAIEDTTVVLLSEEDLLKLENQFPSFRNFNHRLLHNHIVSLQQRTISLLSQTAEERYLTFIKTYPDIPLRVPQTMIASYLGITPESLSRVRKEIANRNR